MHRRRYRNGYKGNLIGYSRVAVSVAPPCEAAGWLLTEKMAEMKHGEPMEFLTFEDQTAMYDAMLFPDAYRAIAIR